MALPDLRGLFSLVLQDVHLFSGTIADNIRLGDSSLDDAQIERAARAVHADRFIERLPGRYYAPVAERGASLSVGQKQLLSFARALAFDPRVLILDEATSSVDTETELLIRDALETLMAGRTTIAIAHRLSTDPGHGQDPRPAQGSGARGRHRTRSCWRRAASTSSCSSCSTRTRRSRNRHSRSATYWASIGSGRDGSARDSSSGCSRCRNRRFMKPGAVARGFHPRRRTVRRTGLRPNFSAS